MKTQTIRQRLLHSTMIGGSALSMALIAAPAVGLIAPTAAFAQSATQGALSGVVENQAGSPLAGATVTLRSTSQGFTRTVTTDASGAFRAVALPQGQYEVTAAAEGYEALSDTVSIGSGGTTSITLTVGAAAGGATDIDEVVVVGVRQAVSEFDATTTGLTVNVEELSRNVPLARDATAVALLAPGVVQSDSAFGKLPSISGASAGENTYYINGLNVTDFVSFLGGSSIPFEFYQTFETKTGGYSAEFGRATGGVVNATTKSGGNEWEFGITGYWEPDSLAEQAPNTYLQLNEFDESESKDIVLEAGGPIIPDRLFIYGIYNWRDRESFGRNTSGIGTRISDDSPFYGAKIDFLLNDDHRIEGTYWSDDNETEISQTTYYAANAGSREDGTYTQTSGGENWILRYTGVWTDWLTTSLAYGENENQQSVTSPEDANPMITDITGFDYNGDGILDVENTLIAQRGNWLVGSPSTNDDLRKMFRADVDVYASLFGEHHFRFGLDYEKLESSQTLQRSGQGITTCRPGGPINAAIGLNCFTGGVDYRYQTPFTAATIPAGRTDLIGAPRRVRVTVYDNSGAWEAEQRAFYIQDSWEVTDRLVLNLGIRNEAFENSNIAGEVFADIKDQWAPRVGFTYDVLGDRSSKLFGFYGRYFLPVAVNTNQRLAGAELFFRDTYNLDLTGGPNDVNRDGINDTDETPILGSIFSQSTFGIGDVKPIATAVDQDLESMYVDEFILGYEQKLGASGWTAAIKGTYRELGRAIDDIAIDRAVLAYCASAGGGLTEAGCYSVWYGFHQYVLTNPGEDVTVTLSGADLAAASGGVVTQDRVVTLSAEDLEFPKPTREYKAVELSLEKDFDGIWGGRFSYVWSDSEGNYEGALKSDNGQVDPGLSQDFDAQGLLDGAYGKLPGHREHTFKAFGSWQATENLLIGANLLIQSPREFGCIGVHPTDTFASFYGAASFFCDLTDDGVRNSIATPRGSLFESDWLKTLDLTFSYNLGDVFGMPGDGLTLRADVFNVFNSQAELDYNEFGETDVGLYPGPGQINPNFARVTGYQSPRYVRLGVSYRF